MGKRSKDPNNSSKEDARKIASYLGWVSPGSYTLDEILDFILGAGCWTQEHRDSLKEILDKNPGNWELDKNSGKYKKLG